MVDFIIKRRGTEVIPSSVELGNKVNNALNILFITWSVLVIIMYLSSVDIPDYIDIIVSTIAIGIALSHQLYTFIEYRKSGVNKISIDPIKVPSKPVQNIGSNIELLDLNKIKITV
jgi:hypothetical protein